MERLDYFGLWMETLLLAIMYKYYKQNTIDLEHLSIINFSLLFSLLISSWLLFMKSLQYLILLLTNLDILDLLLFLYLSLHFFDHPLSADIHVIAPQLIALFDLSLSIVILVLEFFYGALFVLGDELRVVFGHFIYKYCKEGVRSRWKL